MPNGILVKPASQANSIGEIYDAQDKLYLILSDGPHAPVTASGLSVHPFELVDVSQEIPSMPGKGLPVVPEQLK